jgi:hypothetical protein
MSLLDTGISVLRDGDHAVCNRPSLQIGEFATDTPDGGPQSRTRNEKQA